MKKIKILISCIITLCLTCGMLGYMTDLLERKASDYKYNEFFEEKQNFDVLFMGTSNVINGIYPMELWNDYGIASYNMGGHSNHIPTTYWVMRNALDYTKPKLIVLDCLAIERQVKTSDRYSMVHLSLDAFPFSMTKVEAVYDLTNDPEMDKKVHSGEVRETTPRTKLELLWNYSVYHSRWNEISQNDFENPSGKEKGAEIRVAVTPTELKKIDSDMKLQGETTGTEYLRRTIEECKKQGIDVLLTYLPFAATEEQQMSANRVYDIAQEYDVNYINFLDEEVVDFSTDCFDAHTHLNPSGAKKVTDYLGKYIMEHYDVEDHRNDEKYAHWHEDYKEYKKLKVSHLKNQKDLKLYLMLIADKNYDVTIDMKNTDILWEKEYKEVFENLGIDYDNVKDDTNRIVVTEGGKQVEYESVNLKDEEGDFGIQITVSDVITKKTIGKLEC